MPQSDPTSFASRPQPFLAQCVVGSLAGNFSPANVVSYSSTKAFINMFTTSLRVLAAPSGIDVVCVQPGFIDMQTAKQMHGQGSSAVGQSSANPRSSVGVEELAVRMKDGVEKGGRGIVMWPGDQGVAMHAFRGVFYFGAIGSFGLNLDCRSQPDLRGTREVGLYEFGNERAEESERMRRED